MKLSSISLVGAVLAAIVVVAIAVPVPHSLGHGDGELVDDLFTRATREEAKRRRQEVAGDTHLALASAHYDAAKAHMSASLAQEHTAKEIAAKEITAKETKSSYHHAKAEQHWSEANYHSEQYDLNFAAAGKAYAGTRTKEQKRLIKYPSDATGPTLRCANDARVSEKHAKDILAYHNSGGEIQHPGLLAEISGSRHRDFPIPLRDYEKAAGHRLLRTDVL